METIKIKLSEIRSLLIKDDLKSVFKQLHILFANSPKLSIITLQNARFSDISKQINLGIVTFEDANVTKNQIRVAVLDLLDEIEEQSKTPEIQDEIQKAVLIVNSKNVITGNIQAGGDVHIGDKTIQNAEKIYNIDKIDKADFS